MKISVKEHSQPLYDINILDEDLLNGVEILIGREDDCHIKLDSHLVSRYHAKAWQKDGEMYLEVTSDYGGVYRNGSEVREIVIRENDKFSLSDYEFTFSNIPKSKPVDLVIDEAFSKTELIDKVKDETVQIPAELEEMMAVDPLIDLPDSSLDNATDFLENASELDEELVAEEDFEDNSEIRDNTSIDSLADDFETEMDSDQPIDDGEFGEVLAEGESLEEEAFDDENKDFELSAAAEGDVVASDDSFNQEPDFMNDGFDGNDEFGDPTTDSTSEETGATQVYQSFAKFKLKIFGEYAPLDTFLIEGAETKIGRDEECDIILNDPEVSKVHAIIKKTLVSCVLIDNDSSNGIIINGERTKKVELTNGDEFIIGDTTFTVEVKSDIIEAEKNVLMPVEHGQEVEIEEIVEEEVDFDNFDEEGALGEQEVVEKSFIKRILKDKRKRLYLIVGVVLFGFFLLLSEDEQKKPAVKEDKKKEVVEKKENKYSERDRELLEQNYSLALDRFQTGNFSEAKEFLDVVERRDPEYKDTATLSKSIEEGIAEIKRIEEQKRLEKEKQEMLIKVKGLVEKARKAIDEKNMLLAKSLFNEILERDPENIDVPSMKLEVEYYESDKKRKELAERIAKEKRDSMVNKLKPGKTAFLKEDWYQAAEKLERFIQEKDMDEDLVKEATEMLKESRKKLKSMLAPMISKARSFKEGQDLKQAYETYGDVLKLDPGNEEALNERDAIFRNLENRSKKVYREALIAESLSLYPKAKEKFEEVKQISPDNSEYYRKAVEKLRNYLE